MQPTSCGCLQEEQEAVLHCSKEWQGMPASGWNASIAVWQHLQTLHHSPARCTMHRLSPPGKGPTQIACRPSDSYSAARNFATKHDSQWPHAMFQRCRGFTYCMICLERIAAQNMHIITITGIRIPGSYSSEFKPTLDRYQKSAVIEERNYRNSLDWFHQASALQILQSLVYLQLLKICSLLQIGCPDAYTAPQGYRNIFSIHADKSYNETTHQHPQICEYTCICSLLNGLINQHVFWS